MNAEIPTSFGANGQSYTFGQIHNRFAESPYGKILSEKIRWGIFKPPELSNTDWQQIVGVDANNLGHLSLSYRLGRVFLTQCMHPPVEWKKPVPPEAVFTPDEQGFFLLTTVHHDWGETIRGDVAHTHKKTRDEYIEYVNLLRITRNIFPEDSVYPNIRRGVKNILLDTNSKLGRTFHAFEFCGYHRTSVRAWEYNNSGFLTNYPDLKDRLRAIAFSVHTHVFRNLIAYADIYPPIYSQLFRSQEIISQILTTPPAEAGNILNRYENHQTPDEIAYEWKLSQQAWTQWLTANK